MQYRALGRTGLKVSQLGFGAMRLPMVGEGDKAVVDREKAVPLMRRAFEMGVNYIDTAQMYCNNDSQAAVGEAIKGWREKLVVSTKNIYYGESESEWRAVLENSLKKLGVEALDVYHHHAVNWQQFSECVLPRVGKWMSKVKAEGLVKHVAVSFHDQPEALTKILEREYAEVITVQYNMLDRSLEKSIALAHQKGVGVIVMGPVAGGRLGSDAEIFQKMVPGLKRVPELAMRFVLANPNVTVALSGMGTMEMVEENLRVCSDTISLSPEDMEAIETHLKRLKAMADLYCTGCGYCKPCSQKVDIPAVFGRYNEARIYGLWKNAKDSYQWLIKMGWAADKCTQCGECEGKCPQKIEIRRQLEEAHAALTA
jgi:predicted aldo/keto reductase-like oxidoreductase